MLIIITGSFRLLATAELAQFGDASRKIRIVTAIQPGDDNTQRIISEDIASAFLNGSGEFIELVGGIELYQFPI